MKLTSAGFLLATLLSRFQEAQAKAVFAHFMVGNVASWSEARWETEIGIAQVLKLDAFALNIAYGDNTASASVANAFTAANAKGFKLFFSFDYAGGTKPWPQADVLRYLTSYVNSGAYYHTAGGQPFVSTFEGPGSAADWHTIKARTNAFFMPDYSSIGAGPALATGVADGLFNWAAWPWGPQNMNTFVDASYYQALGKSNVLGQPGAVGKPYMMGVSPMFYTNLPGYDKNWLWNGDRLWFDRWQEVLFLQPEYVEIISWNDWGECHYIAPLDPTQWEGVFGPSKGNAAYNYADGLSHDGWSEMLPFLIDLYKTNQTSLEVEVLTAWGRSTPATAPGCSSDRTSGNTASQLQIEYPPASVVEDAIYIMALLASPGNVSVSIGGEAVKAQWSTTPAHTPGNAAAGFYFGKAPIVGSGPVSVQIARSWGVLWAGGGNPGSGSDAIINASCPNGITNWNMWAMYSSLDAAWGDSKMDITDYTCVNGSSDNADYDLLCQFSCSRGYCPPGACSCMQVGPSPTVTIAPGQTAGPGYPVQNVEFAGLCAFACGKGYCPPAYCTSVSTPVPTPTISPFNPDACAGGESALDASFADLCSWACGYGYCPIAACDCVATGVLTQPPPTLAASVTASFLPTPGVMAFDDLCRFNCARGHCPSVCSANIGCVSGTGTGGYEGLCDYACGRGFCPSPCTCGAQGSPPSPTGYLSNVVGYGAPGLADDYDPLCNFTCSHGYCPPNVCAQEISIDATPTSPVFATITGLEAESATPSYPPGAIFEYTSPDNESLSMDVLILNAGATTDYLSFRCTDEPAVAGPDGEALGCIAEGTAWMFWAIYAAGGEAEITTPDNDTDTSNTSSNNKRSSGSSNRSFQYHAEWQPSGNCSTSQCMLLATAPEGVWTPAGNGTSSSGVYHELYFIRSGGIHGHAAYPDGRPTSSTIASRQYKDSLGNGALRYYRDNAVSNYSNGFFDDTPNTYQYGQYDFVGASVEKTVAQSQSSSMCMGFMTLSEEIDYGYLVLGPNSDASEDEAAAAAARALEYDCARIEYYTGCNTPWGDILESNVGEPEDPGNPSTELEEYEWELDCYMPGVANSGDPSDDLLYPLEQRRKRSVSDYLDLLPPEMLEDLDVDLYDNVYSLLEKRGGSRQQKICKNPAGKSRTAVTASFSSSTYRSAVYLAGQLGKPIYALDGRTCAAAGLQTLKSIANLPKGMKVVAEHVLEIQFVKTFFQAMRDGVVPGGGTLSTGQLPWAPFDETNPSTATFFLSWSSILTTVPSQGTVVSESFYDAVGTLSDTSNNLVLDSLTNGLKATIWAGAKNIVYPTKWSNMSNAGRLGTLQRIKAVYDYLNTVDGQNALASAYGNLQSLTPFLTQALLQKNAISYDTKTAFTEYARAHFNYMVANTITWVTPKLAEEATFWATATAGTFYGAKTAQNNLALVQNMQKMTWAAITTTWLK